MGTQVAALPEKTTTVNAIRLTPTSPGRKKLFQSSTLGAIAKLSAALPDRPACRPKERADALAFSRATPDALLLPLGVANVVVLDAGVAPSERFAEFYSLDGAPAKVVSALSRPVADCGFPSPSASERFSFKQPLVQATLGATPRAADQRLAAGVCGGSRRRRGYDVDRPCG